MQATTNFWAMRPAEEINDALASVPLAEQHEIKDAVTGEDIPNRFATVVDGEVIDISSDKYVLKQTPEVFRHTINGLTVRGISDFKFSLWATKRKASMALYVGEAEDGVKFGFKVTNSYDRSSSIKHKMNAYRRESSVQLVEKEHVLVWGYRQACANGMVVKVPLKVCKYMDAVKVSRIKQLLTIQTRIIHLGDNVDSKLERTQHLVEGFLLLKGPLNMMIIDAQNYQLTRPQAKRFLMKYIGKRRLDKYLELYGREEQTLWGLYNSITFFASHSDKLSPRIRERLLVGAGDLLTGELLAVAETGGYNG